MNSTAENGRSVLGVAPGDGRIKSFTELKAGPAEVLVSAGNVPATGHWQPIEAAPKDVWVIAYLPWVNEVRQARYNLTKPGKVGWKVCFGSSQVTCVHGEPSHWMPLPDPPASSHLNNLEQP